MCVTIAGIHGIICVRDAFVWILAFITMSIFTMSDKYTFRPHNLVNCEEEWSEYYYKLLRACWRGCPPKTTDMYLFCERVDLYTSETGIPRCMSCKYMQLGNSYSSSSSSSSSLTFSLGSSLTSFYVLDAVVRFEGKLTREGQCVGHHKGVCS